MFKYLVLSFMANLFFLARSSKIETKWSQINIILVSSLTPFLEIVYLYKNVFRLLLILLWSFYNLSCCCFKQINLILLQDYFFMILLKLCFSAYRIYFIFNKRNCIREEFKLFSERVGGVFWWLAKICTYSWCYI